MSVSPGPRRASRQALSRRAPWALVGAVLLAIAATVAAVRFSPAPAPAASTGVYGSAQGDSRNNFGIGRNNARVAYRFRASTTAAATSVRVQQRGLGGGSTYSGGNGGTIKVSIQTDSNGVPSGTILSSMTFAPGNPSGNWEVWDKLTFAAPATLTAGRLYHVVMENIDASPTTNYISVNALFYLGGPLTPRQPTWSDDYALLFATPTTWAVQANNTPIMDLAYADGVHDGMNYIGSMGPSYGSITGTSSLVREHFTVSGGDRTVTSASVKVKRISGTSPLTISLKSGATVLESGTVTASTIPTSPLPTVDTAQALGGNVWATITFPPRVLANGSTYDLVLSTAADTQYVAVPVQEGTTKGMLSRAFTDGGGQKTTDGGATWSYLYPHPDNGRQDLQFYLR